MNLTGTPLVSVVIITYNSQDYIIDALESVRQQTYENIELVVTDDCSSDDTVALCSNWINKNSERFRNCQLIESDHNTGTPSNCNRGIKSCHGEWVKLFAGDDMLLDNCISTFVSNITNESKILVGMIQPFSKDENGKEKLGPLLPEKDHLYFFDRSAAFQFKYLLNNSFNFAPSAFIKMEVYRDLNYYDERFRVFEDLPFWIKATKSGIKINLIKETVVKYRTSHESAVFSQKNFFNVRFRECLYDFHFRYIQKNVKWYNWVYYESFYMDYFAYKIITGLLGNKRGEKSHFVSGLFNRLKLSRYYYKIVDRYYSKYDS